VKVSQNAPLKFLAPLGCGLQTGAGAILNVLKVKPGSTIAVVGVGAVGLAAVMAAKIAHSGTIIAIDVHQERLTLASELGATHEILSRDNDIYEGILKVVPDGVQYAIDCTGVPRIIEQLVKSLSVKGTTLTIGSPGQGQTASINIFDHLAFGRSYMGTHQGDSNPQEVQLLWAEVTLVYSVSDL
jgi:Zn-dependent alcohol dehydrogenase